MDNSAFRYELSFQEAFYLMFKRKKCPCCGGSMTKEKKSEIKSGAEFIGRTETFYPPGTNVKVCTYQFVCSQCGSRYPLSNLANRKG